MAKSRNDDAVLLDWSRISLTLNVGYKQHGA
jgi:hypothetical protein